MDQLRIVTGNYFFMVPVTVLIVYLVLRAQKQSNGKNVVLDDSALWKNSVFVGLLMGVVLYLNKPLPGLEDSINVRPANF